MEKEFGYFKVPQYSNSQLSILVLLRVIIGWHIFYEGFTKLLNPGWTSVGFLMDSKGWFAGIFHAMAGNESVLRIIDILNVWGLLIIGFCLIVGLFEKAASIGGMLLLGMYYLSHPPFLGLVFDAPGEGSYLIVNKNLIEITALGIILYFPSSRIIGVDRLIYQFRNN